MKNNQLNKKKNIFLFIVIIFILKTTAVIALSTSTTTIGAKQLHGSITGAGLSACIIDDGVDYTHPALGGCTMTNDINDGSCNKVVGGYDFGDDDSNPYPQSGGHGTKIAGIIASMDATYTGVAPDAKIVAIDVSKDDGSDSFFQFFSKVEKGLNWCIDNRSKFNISVISISLGDPTISGQSESCSDVYNLQDEINKARMNNILVIIASGNDGNITGIKYPACLSNATSVGSTDGKKISSYTDRGTNLDLLAPGDWIKTTKKGGGFTKLPKIICSLFYPEVDCTIGTSFAAPHVAGAVLLVKQYDSALKSKDMENLLKDNGKNIFDAATSLSFPQIDLLSALNVLDWPTENHDYRRTGFTLLKGDMSQANDVEKTAFVLQTNVTKEQTLKPVVADIDGNGKMEIVTVVHDLKYSGYDVPVTNRSDIYAVEINKGKPVQKWNFTIFVNGPGGGAVYFPPTLANIDGDQQKEMILGVRNGTVFAYDISPNGKTVSERWKYVLRPKYSPQAAENRVYFNGGTAVVDIDLDGTNEIIFADVFETDPDWPGEVYVLKDNGPGNQPTKFANYTFGEGGAFATVSIANLDSDDNPEIIVPSMYGIYVFDYDPSAQYKLSKKWNNYEGKIKSSAVITDVDQDNKYELVYTTIYSATCPSGKTCYNRLYVVDGETAAVEKQINLNNISEPTPSVANLDSDSNLEIVIITKETTDPLSRGEIRCYDAVTGASCAGSWPFNDSGKLNVSFISPNIADIDNNGKNNVVFAENNGNQVIVLKEDGTKLFNYSFEGFVDTGIAIADVDQDSVAELMLKRAGSPITLFSTLSSLNKPPALLNNVPNITAIAGELININATGEVGAFDFNTNDTLTFSYSAPFNSSGLWQTTINDSGNYSVLIEVSDGNLSTYQYLDLIVFPEHTKVLENFTDNSSKKVLDYAGLINKSVQIRLPKDAMVIYSQITLTGGAP